jgi:hypothetical protein
MEIFQNEAENVKQWRDTLFQVVGIYLLLGARRYGEANPFLVMSRYLNLG